MSCVDLLYESEKFMNATLPMQNTAIRSESRTGRRARVKKWSSAITSMPRAVTAHTRDASARSHTHERAVAVVAPHRACACVWWTQEVECGECEYEGEAERLHDDFVHQYQTHAAAH